MAWKYFSCISEVSHKHNNHMIISTNLRTLLDYLWSVLIIFITAQICSVTPLF